MNGLRPTMCVTVLQSHPSVSMPTLTMQRMSFPGGDNGRPSLPASSSKPSGYIGLPNLSLDQSALPTVFNVNRNQGRSSTEVST